MRDLFHNIKNLIAVLCQVVTAAVTGVTIDRQGFDSVTFVANVGQGATLNASNYIALAIQHAEDDGTGNPDTWEDCTDEDVLGVTGLTSGAFRVIDAADEDETTYQIGYRGERRFVRTNVATVGSPSCPVGITAILGHPSDAPATKDVANA